MVDNSVSFEELLNSEWNKWYETKGKSKSDLS